jgi:hypothetical protein
MGSIAGAKEKEKFGEILYEVFSNTSFLFSCP